MVKKEQRTFNQGMQKDLDVRFIKEGQYIDALNIRAISTDNGRDGAVENTKSNTLKETTPAGAEYTMPDGINRCIGAVEDTLNSTNYWFIWNSEGSHLILRYNQKSDTIEEIIKDNDYTLDHTFDAASVTLYEKGDVIYDTPSDSYSLTRIDVTMSSYNGVGGSAAYANSYLFEPLGDYLDFQEDYLIQSKVVIKDEKVLLFWTDKYNEEGNERVRYINVTDYIGVFSIYPTVPKKSHFDVAPDAPLFRPTTTSSYTSNIGGTYLRGKFFQFKYRYIGLESQPSTWSPYSEIQLYTHNSIYSGTDFDNVISIKVDRPNGIYPSVVTRIEVAARDCGNGNSGDWHIIKSIDASDTTSSIYNELDTTTANEIYGVDRGSDETPYSYTIDWSNNGDWTPINLDEAGNDYCFTPQSSETIEILNDNRLSLGNNTIGYDISLINSEVTITAAYAATGITNDYDAYEKTLKKDCDYEVALRYSDGKSRQTTAILDESNYTLHIDYPHSTHPASTPSFKATASIDMDIAHDPPSWAKSWQILLRPAANIAYEFSTPDFIQYTQSGTTALPVTLQNLTSAYGAGNYRLISMGDIQSWQYDHLDNRNITYSFTEGDRYRTYSEYAGAVQSEPTTYANYMLQGIITTGDENFVLSLTTDTPTANDVIENYSTNTEKSEFWYEFGEAKSCGYDTAGDWSHLSISTNNANCIDQVVGSVSATTFATDADCYLAQITYKEPASYPPTELNSRTGVPLYMEQAWADYAFDSKSNDRGRANVLSDTYGRYTSTTRIQFSQPIVQETERTDFSLMYDGDFVDNNNQFGALHKMYQMNQNLYIFQEDRIGYRPVARQIIEDLASQSLVGISGEILGNVNYLPYDYGISENPESFAVYGGDMFCSDAQRAAVLKIRGNQIEPISDKGMKTYFDSAFQGAKYYQTVRVFGEYDIEFEEYVMGIMYETRTDNLTSQSYITPAFECDDPTGDTVFAYNPDGDLDNGLPDAFQYINKLRYIEGVGDPLVEAIGTDYRSVIGGKIELIGLTALSPAPYTTSDPTRNAIIAIAYDTLAFSNRANAWSTRYSYSPETMVKSSVKLASFNSGKMYIHNDPLETTYGSFYGTQYNATLKFPLNAIQGQNKIYNTIGINGNSPWSAEITNYKGQQTNIILGDYQKLEGIYWADVLRDENTPIDYPTGHVRTPVLDGDYMIDDHAIVELTSTQDKIEDITITTQGSGYTTAPTVTFSGGGGTGATAYARIQNGRVVEVVITNSGSGYTSAPTVVFSSGSAAATATITTGLHNLYSTTGTFNISRTLTV